MRTCQGRRGVGGTAEGNELQRAQTVRAAIGRHSCRAPCPAHDTYGSSIGRNGRSATYATSRPDTTHCRVSRCCGFRFQNNESDISRTLESWLLRATGYPAMSFQSDVGGGNLAILRLPHIPIRFVHAAVNLVPKSLDSWPEQRALLHFVYYRYLPSSACGERKRPAFSVLISLIRDTGNGFRKLRGKRFGTISTAICDQVVGKVTAAIGLTLHRLL